MDFTTDSIGILHSEISGIRMQPDLFGSSEMFGSFTQRIRNIFDFALLLGASHNSQIHTRTRDATG